MGQFSQIWPCPHNNSLRVWARISILAGNGYLLGTLLNFIENGVVWPSPSFLSNVYIAISLERVDQLTSEENHFDRWVTEKKLNVKNEGYSHILKVSYYYLLVILLIVEGRGVITSGTDALVSVVSPWVRNRRSHSCVIMLTRYTCACEFAALHFSEK